MSTMTANGGLTTKMAKTPIRPPILRRSWLFIGGVDAALLMAAPETEADVLIYELEDFTPPDQRPRARELCGAVLASWKKTGSVAAVRINPLTDDGSDDAAADGLADLTAVMAHAPDAVLLPKVAEPEHVDDLDREIARLEKRYGLTLGSTEIVPNIELARGIMQTHAICLSSPRISGCVMASEDLAADLGAERSPDGSELAYARGRFHLECTAAGIPSIDCPYTWTDASGLEADALAARRLGFKAKSCVHGDHAAVINRVLTPTPTEIDKAERIIDAFERAQKVGSGRAEVDGSLVEVPIYLNAKRLVERTRALAGWYGGLGRKDKA